MPQPAPAEAPSWSPSATWGSAGVEVDEIEAPPAEEGAPESTQVFPTSWSPPEPMAPREDRGSLDPMIGDIRTRLAKPDPELDDDVEAEPTTAEQAVPWLIGFILLLAGMVIVLLALIFAGDESLGANALGPSASESATPRPSAEPVATATPQASASVAPSASAAEATAVPATAFGPLEMVYQGRAAALAPIYLLHHDFTTEEEPATMAQDPSLDVRRFAWSRDGQVGAGLLADVLVSIEEGKEKRRLGDGIVTITFGEDGATVYAVRITEDGANDVATVLAIDFESGETDELASINYPRPDIAAEEALVEAQFADDGGAVRLFWMHAGTLRLWALGAGTWDIDPASGDVTDLEEELPLLWAPGGRERIALSVDEGTTSINRVGMDGDTLSSTSVEGLVSHVRWSSDRERIVFTVGRTAAGGGILQDLFLWDLGDEGPTQLTSTGAAFGAEWLGNAPRWQE